MTRLPSAASRSPAATALARVAVGAVFISFAPVLVKLAHVGPTPAAFYRMSLGGLLLAVVALMRRQAWWAGRRHLAVAAGCGAFLALDLALWHRSINLVGPGLATLLANLQVFFLAGFGLVLLRERLTARLAVAIPVAVLGLYLILGLEWGGLGPRYRLGVVFGVLTAMSYAAYLLTLRAARARAPGVHPIVTLATVSLISAAVLAVTIVLEGDSFGVPDATTWVVLAGYALVPQVAGWVLIATALPHVAASRAGLVLLLQPALAFVWDLLFFGRPTTLVELAGALLTLGAIYLGTTGTEPRPVRSPEGER